MKKLLSFMLILSVFVLNSSLIMGMGVFGKKEQVSKAKTLLETIFTQIDAAKKDGESDIEDLNNNLNLLIEKKDDDALIEVLQKMKDTFFYYVPLRVPGTWHGKKLDIKRFNELENFFLNLIILESENFSNENIYKIQKIFNDIIRNVDNNITQNVEKNLKELTQNNYELYQFAIDELINPSELAKKDFEKKGVQDKSQYMETIENISKELLEFLENSAGYSSDEARTILGYTFEDEDFIEKISNKNKEAYFSFLKKLFIALGDREKIDNFAQQAADANEQFRGRAFWGMGKGADIPVYKEIYIGLLKGNIASPTAPAAPESAKGPESDLSTALTKFSVELSALNAQL